MKFVFVYPDFEYRRSTHGWFVEKGGWYHEGIAQLGAIVEKAGWNVSLIHPTEPMSKKEYQERIVKEKPDVVGLSLRIGNRLYGEKVVKWTKEVLPKTIVVLGAYFPTLEPERAINIKGVDAIFLGESEIPLQYFLAKVSKGKSFEKTPSTWVKTSKGIVKNPIAPLVEDLDSLPIPKFDMFDFSKFIGSKLKIALGGITRGCLYNCSYCWNNINRKLYPNKDKYVRYRSPKNATKYLKQLLKAYPEAKKIRFQDDLWPAYTDWLQELKELYIKKINLPFDCNYRANLFTEEIAKNLKEMGCQGIYFGVESGDDYIRNKILRRGMKVEHLEKAFALCRKYKIKTYAYNIIGAPHENLKTTLATVKLNAKLRPNTMFFAIYFPYGGTDLHHLSIKEGFYDPKKPLDPEVNIIMPDFSYYQIKFAGYYARTFVNLYKFAYAMPKFIGKPLEKLIDKIWLYKNLPYKKLVTIKTWWDATILKIKIFIKEKLTPLYFILKR